MKSWFKISNHATDGTERAEILIFDEIGMWGVTAKDFATALAEIPAETPLTVGIDSPGGDVTAGIAIYNLLRMRGDSVTVRIDGMAASIASVIACAGHRVVMPDNTLMMIHQPWTFAGGNADEMRETADVLDKFNDQIVRIYEAKSGKTSDEIREAMKTDKWMDANECLAFGLIDEVLPLVTANAAAKHLQDYNFKNLPSGFSASAKPGTNPPKNNDMKKLITALLAAGFVPADNLEDADAASAFKEALKAHQDELTKAQNRITDLETQSDEQLTQTANAAVVAAIDAGALDDSDENKTFWINCYRTDSEGTQKQLQALAAKKPAPEPKPQGAAPVPQDEAGEGNSRDIDTVRAAIRAEKNPNRKAELLRKARDLRFGSN